MDFVLDSLRLTILNEDNFIGEYKIGPLHRGYGITIGNALRRVLLSSIDGIAVTAVQIEGIYHQFTSIPYLLEDAIQLVSNIKKIIIKGNIQDRKVLSISIKGKKEIKAGDLICPSDIEIINKDFVLANLVEDDAKFTMNLYVEKGKGYRFADENKDTSLPIGAFPIDSNFTPVISTSFEIKHAMVNESLKYEMLTMKIQTNNSISPYDCLKNANNILIEYFSNILIQKEFEEVASEELPSESVDILKRPIEEIIPLSVRTSNVFKKAGIYTVSDLFNKNKKELLSLKNFGMKSLTSTIEELMKIPEIEKLESKKELPLVKDILTGEIGSEAGENEEGEAEEIEKIQTSEMSNEIKEVLEQPIEILKDTIGLSETQISKLKKFQIEIIEHLIHMKKEDLLEGNNKLPKKYVDKIEEYLIENNLKFKD